jgi:hypothetical protein
MCKRASRDPHAERAQILSEREFAARSPTRSLATDSPGHVPGDPDGIDEGIVNVAGL